MHNPTKTTSRQRLYSFPNGLGASVISDGYGSESGAYELGVLDAQGNLTYATPITTDVLGWLSEAEVQSTLDRIAALTVDEIREHREAKELRDDWKWAVETDATDLGFEDWKAAR
jgi:hypothetical protein